MRIDSTKEAGKRERTRPQYIWHLLISIAMKDIMHSSNFRPPSGVPDE